MASASLTLSAVNSAAAHRTPKTQGSLSRSTSAGSSSPETASATRTQELPDLDYPLPFTIRPSPTFQDMVYPSQVVIKNTFLDSPVERPASLDGFLRQRDICSCPPGAIGTPPGWDSAPRPKAGAGAARGPEEPRGFDFDYPSPVFVRNTLVHEPLEQVLPERGARSCPGSRLAAVPEQDLDEAQLPTPFPSYIWEAQPAQRLQLAAAVPPPAPSTLPLQLAAAVSPPASPPQAPQAPLVVRIAEALPEPQVGSPECPTEGSVAHRFGTCKPCAFRHTKGCNNGFQCPFCHLCGPGERKRRQKQKHALEAQQRAQDDQQDPQATGASTLWPWAGAGAGGLTAFVA